MKRRVVLRVLELVLSLHGLTTAHYKAREPSSVKAAAGLLFFCIFKKKLSQHMRRSMQLHGTHGSATRFGMNTAPTGAPDGSKESQ